MENKKMLKKSYYSFFIPQENNSYIIYNSFTGVIISVNEEDITNRINELIEQEDIFYEENDELVDLFYKKGILVDKIKNEYKYVRYAYERDIIRDNTLVLTLIVTRQCNLRCIYCYEKHENLPMVESIYERILKFIENSLKNKRYSNVSISLFGGEPFVEYEKVVNFLSNVKKICTEYNAGYSSNATTNGALIYPERFEVLSELNCNYYQITIDGFAETHDKYRVSSDKKGSWNKIINNLKYMSSTDHNFKVTIRTNFNDEVFKEAEEFYKYIKDNFDDRFSVYYEGIKRLGGSNDDNIEILDANDVSKSSLDIARVLKRLGIKNDVVDTMTRPYSRVCYASKYQNYLIDYDGSILKCTLALDDELNKIGFIDENGYMCLDEIKNSNWVAQKIDLDDQCKKCKVLPICFGGRCVNGRVHGQKYECNSKQQEDELQKLIINF